MSVYYYASNLSDRDRFDQIQMSLDNGKIVVLRRRSAYDLTPSEVARARRFVVMSSSPATPEQANVVGEIPIAGSLTDGDILVWDSTLGVFIPTPSGSVGGGGGGGSGNSRVLLWNGSTYAPTDWLSDDSVPREFRGPTNPATMSLSAPPVFGDIWTPTGIPT